MDLARSRHKPVILASAASLVLHALGLFWFKALATLPPIPFELTKPDSAEFGVADAPSEAPPPD